MLVPVTTSRDEFTTLLACDLMLMQVGGASKTQMERFAARAVRLTYGIAESDVAASLEGQIMRITCRVPVKPEEVLIRFTIKEPTVFEVNAEDWADAKPGAMRAVPASAPSHVQYEVFDGKEWRKSGSPVTLYAADVHDVTSTPTHLPTR